MRFLNTLSFIVGALFGAIVTFWNLVGGDAPPDSQETTVRNLTYTNLKSEDSWLLNTQPSLVPLTNVRSSHKYAILIFTPSPNGIPISPAHTSILNLVTKDLVQPIGISSSDFGPKGDRTVVKFIDELGAFQEVYSSASALTLTSGD